MSEPVTQGRRAGRRAGNVGEGADGGGASVGWGNEPEPNPSGGENADGPPSPDGPQHGRRKGGATAGWGEPGKRASTHHDTHFSLISTGV